MDPVLLLARLVGLSEQVRAQLTAGHFAGRRVVLPHGGSSLDAALAARIVLADVDHCLFLRDCWDGMVPPQRAHDLLAQLQALARVPHAAAERAPRP